MEIRMDGRTALITGGSAGMGKAMAVKFADAGASVAIVARRPDVLEAAKAEVVAAAKGGKVGAYACDVTDLAQIEAVHRQAVADLGPIDILVNNAGQSMAKPFDKVSDADWQADLDLKLFAAIRLTRLVLPGMKERRWGRIVNVLNIGAKAQRPESAPTSVSRAAGMALTKVLAGECAPHNVLVNALLTGFIVSEQWTKRHAKVAPNQPFDEYLAEQAKALQIPLGRFGEAEEFANIACFLCSDAGGYITGTAINVDGNRCPVV